MSTPANVNKAAVAQIRVAAGIAAGAGDYALANRLYQFEADLRQRGREGEKVLDVVGLLRQEYVDEIGSLISHGLETSRIDNAYARGLRRGLELLGVKMSIADAAREATEGPSQIDD